MASTLVNESAVSSGLLNTAETEQLPKIMVVHHVLQILLNLERRELLRRNVYVNLQSPGRSIFRWRQ